MSASAYELSLFSDEDGERRRLTSQAKTCFPFEMPVYREFGLDKGIRLLDVGSGNGEPACLLQSEGLDVTCVDRDPKQVEHLPPAVPFFAGEATQLPFDNNVFDAAFSRLVFQHLPEPARTLQEMRRVVKPGGKIVVCDTDHMLRGVYPALPSVDEALDEWITQARGRGADPSIGGRLQKLFHEAGLTSVQVRIVPISTQMIGAKRFADILFAPFLAVIEESKRRYAETAVVDWVERDPFAAAFFFIAVGHEPSTS